MTTERDFPADWRERRSYARTTRNPEQVLTDPNPIVRAGILDNPRTITTPGLLDDLWRDPSAIVRERLAKQNPSRGALDPDWRVRLAALTNYPNIGVSTLEKLTCDPHPSIATLANRYLEIERTCEWRQDFDNAITVKLVIPGSCNARCRFCYNGCNGNIRTATTEQKEHWLESFTGSLARIIDAIGDGQPISVDITGNEPTLDADFLRRVMDRLRTLPQLSQVARVTMTTNGTHLAEVAPSLVGVVDYVNISVHDFDQLRRDCVFGAHVCTDDDYMEIVLALAKVNIPASAVCVVDHEIPDFEGFYREFVDWCWHIGFVSLRFRHNVFATELAEDFDAHMAAVRDSDEYPQYVIQQESTPDSHWCQLVDESGFMTFFLRGVESTYDVSPGIEFVVAGDGKLYADYDKRVPIDDYPFPIGYVFDRRRPSTTREGN